MRPGAHSGVSDSLFRSTTKSESDAARLSNTPAIFWLDETRAHDAQIIAKVKAYLAQHDTTGLDIKIPAIAASFEHLGITQNHAKAKVLADTLDQANGKFLENDKSPGHKLGTLDNRGSHFYLCLYWAQALANQTTDDGLRTTFKPVAAALETNEKQIVQELLTVQGKPTDVGGYYQPDDKLASAALRPSNTLNAILAAI